MSDTEEPAKHEDEDLNEEVINVADQEEPDEATISGAVDAGSPADSPAAASDAGGPSRSPGDVDETALGSPRPDAEDAASAAEAQSEDENVLNADPDGQNNEENEARDRFDDGEQPQPTPLSMPPAAAAAAAAAETVRSEGASTRKAVNTPPPSSQTVFKPAIEPPSMMTGSSNRSEIRFTDGSRKDDANIITGNSLSVVWSFGFNKAVPVLNLTTDERNMIMYACAHIGVCYDTRDNTQRLLQGHSNTISCTCVSDDKRWLATGDSGATNSMVIIWDAKTFFPVQTLFNAGRGGVVALALTPDARYLVTVSADQPQVLAVWDWTVDADVAVCTAQLSATYGLQNYVLFNPFDTTQIVSNSDRQVIFYTWKTGKVEFYAPPLSDDDFKKPVGRFSQSIFVRDSSRALTATSLGNLVVWDSNRPLTKVVNSESTPDKKALKLVKVQESSLNVLMTCDAYIVTADANGHIKIFDQSLNLAHWYQDLHIGPINSVSFVFNEKWTAETAITLDGYPADASLAGSALPLRDFIAGSLHSMVASVVARGTDITIVLRNHDSPVHAIATHPTESKLCIGSYSGLLQLWDTGTREVLCSRRFKGNQMIQSVAFDPKGQYLAVGFTSGSVHVLDAITLRNEVSEPFSYARDVITHICFSHDSRYLATADGEFTVSLFKKQFGLDVEPWAYVGRYRSHSRPIQDLMFGIELDTEKPRLLSLGKDRILVEYDPERSTKDNLVLMRLDRAEQSAVPGCMAWYPPITKEQFIVTANDQFKFKMYNANTKMCRSTLLGPTYGSPLKKIRVVPCADSGTSPLLDERRYMAYINADKVGLQILPLDGNPHNAMALVAHPGSVSDLVCSHDGKYLFTAGGADCTVHMWHINVDALEAQSKLGGEGLVPFYGLLEGGREGELFAELEDYFYYAQLRHQGINTMTSREVSTTVPLSEVPYIMRAMGFYPSEQEVTDMLNEVKFSRYVETGQYVNEIDLGEFIKLYINHRPAFGLSMERLRRCFEVLGVTGGGETESRNGSSAMNMQPAIPCSEFLDMLQTRGEHMTEYELAEYLTTLLGYNEEGGSCEQREFDAAAAGDIIVESLPSDVSERYFVDDLLGFGQTLPPQQQGAEILKIDSSSPAAAAGATS